MTFLGRKNRHGYWVAAGRHDELEAAARSKVDVLIELPMRGVIAKIDRVGAPFPYIADEPPWAYGYPVTPIPHVHPRPLRRSRKTLNRARVTAHTPEPTDHRDRHDRSLADRVGAIIADAERSGERSSERTGDRVAVGQDGLW